MLAKISMAKPQKGLPLRKPERSSYHSALTKHVHIVWSTLDLLMSWGPICYQQEKYNTDVIATKMAAQGAAEIDDASVPGYLRAFLESFEGKRPGASTSSAAARHEQ